MNTQFINDKKYRWKNKKVGLLNIAYIGRYASILKLLEFLNQENVLNIPNTKKIIKVIDSMVGNFAVVIETDAWMLGLVDRISGYRLFFRDTHNGCSLSNSPRLLMNKRQKFPNPANSSIQEIKMAAYLTGDSTIDKDISQLCAGRMLLLDKTTSSYVVSNYFEFYSSKIRTESNELLVEELDDITSTIFKRNIEDAADRVVWVPLSGGLDSRLVICKLKQLGCENLRAYSYGSPNNFDALRAKEVAANLNIKWDFISTASAEARKYFLSKKRKEYWDFADGLSVVPNLHGMFALDGLMMSGKMKEDDVIINGQSGDFIAGQHIPKMKNQEANSASLIKSIIDKHYPLRSNMVKDKEIIEVIVKKINNSLSTYKNVTNYQEFAKSYEYWGWKERQTKRVINGQSNYDYYGLNWELPLWDLEYLKFWVDLPLHQKRERSLFVEYLNTMNFYGLFKNKDKFMSRWPINRIYIQFFGSVLSKLFGKKASNLYYKRLDIYSQYQYIYALTDANDYKTHWKNYKGAYPYMTDVWLNENIREGKDDSIRDSSLITL